MPLQTPPPCKPNALDQARTHGRQIGCQMRKLAIDCPYNFDIIELRHQWFAGFSEGRAILKLTLAEG